MAGQSRGQVMDKIRNHKHYCAEKQKWKMGFRDIIVEYNIIDDAKISILCDDGEGYILFLEDGKITE